MTNLILVLDPNYGDHLAVAVRTAPVWAVQSTMNRAACEHIWAAQRTVDHRESGSVTLYDTTDQQDRLGNLLTILPTLEEHHGDLDGDDFSFPAGFVLRAVGLAPTEAVVSALRNLGFSAFVETADGFKTSK